MLSRLLALVTILAISGCARAPSLGTVAGTQAARTLLQTRAAQPPAFTRFGRSSSGGKIQHVVFVIQENRSFNNLFDGFRGATTANTGLDENGNVITLHAESIAQGWDMDHSVYGFFADYDNGKLDGWNTESVCCNEPKDFAYAYAERSQVKPYWDMAKQYVLADNMFQSNLDGSFVAHQYAIAAFSGNAVNYPTTTWGCPGGKGDKVNTLLSDRTIGPNERPCFDYQTLADELDAAGLGWRFYTFAGGDLWSAYEAIHHIYRSREYKKNVVSPPSSLISDVAAGTLAPVTWVTPTWQDSDHAGNDSDTGPSWVTSVVNAVGQSQFWNSTAIFVIWDDWGGWFDSVPPVYEDYDGLGFRIPMIVISPYAKQGYVSHTQYETSSVPRFIEDNFGLGQLAAADARAADPALDCFDFTQTPRPFVPIAAKYPRVYFQKEPLGRRVPDDQ